MESDQAVTKDPETREKMKLIYQWIQAENWMEDEQLLQNVQEIAKTIL